MKILLKIAFGSFCLLALGFCLFWKPRPEWQDGQYRLYSIDSSTMLGLYNDPGYFGLISEEVVAVGSNNEWVVAEQVWKGERRFFTMRKPRGKEFPDDPEGPFTLEEYNKKVVELKLPPFSWRDSRTE